MSLVVSVWLCVCVCVGDGVLAWSGHAAGEGKWKPQMEPVNLGGTPKFAV